MPRLRVGPLAVLVVLALAGCAATPPARGHAPSDAAAVAELLRLNAELVRSQIVDRDTTLFSRVSVAAFRVLAPGGMIEDKARAAAGVAVWDAVGVEVSGEEVVFHGPAAVVTGRLDIDGVMPPVGRWGPLKFMAVFLHEDGEWRQLSRSLTPCLDRLVEMGRC